MKIFTNFLEHSSARYFMVGLLAFSTDYFILVITYYVLHIPLPFAATIGFLAGMVISFFSNRHWVFGVIGQKRHILIQLIEYIFLVIFNFVFTVICISQLSLIGLEPYIGKIIIMGAITLWNYALFRWVIFSERWIN